MLQPRTGVSVAIFRQDRVLLVRRGRGLYAGYWSLPGGSQEPGETLEAAARRELVEETGLSAGPLAFVEFHEPMLRNGDGGLEAHFVLAVYAGVIAEGVARAGDDAAAVRWAGLDELAAIRLTPHAAEIIRRAHARAGAEG